ncbi:hypothetical protein vBOeSunk162_51 [Oenococcus phage vB_OeS_unk162]|nr:hypothetical protein vBOeSunk162_51 [Oenococcus phage vB_OeS_unk162]
MDLIISIKPKYAEQILFGKKTVEYRKTLIKNKIDKFYVYSTAPIKKVIGYFESDGIIQKSPIDLWKETCQQGQIEAKDYFQYFKGKDKAYAISIKKFHPFKKPILLKDFDKNSIPPQSFRYYSSRV